MIPKVIHYCWFGGGALPEKAEKCIDSWKFYCPDYSIIRWDEKNYDYTKNQYMLEAYKAKKWAFVSDYARLDIVYNYGGFYFDTDVELIKSLDGMQDNAVFFGMEDSETIASGLGFGAEKHNDIIKDTMDCYNNLSIYNTNGELNLIPNPKLQTNILKKYGFKEKSEIQKYENLTIYPPEFFCPLNFETGRLQITENTVSIHHFDNSWADEREQLAQRIRWRVNAVFPKLKMQNLALLISSIKCEGIKSTMKRIKNTINKRKSTK